METQRCGKYILHEQLNKGGSAEVFLGISPSNQTVAIRRLLSSYRFNLFKRRDFCRGLEIQSRLDHPYVVKLLEFLPYAMLPYGVMEHVDGPNLRQAILRKEIDAFAPPLAIFQMILEGLNHIHRHGYLHLDFKPENIVLSRHGKAKILDFDLATPTRKTPATHSELKGTPSYLAPEQILKLPVDERTDIFALGITAFELFTGQKPFPNHDRQEIFRINSDFNQPFPAPRSIVPSIPLALDRILSHCIEKNPERRYPTVSMILRDLQKVS